MHAFFLSRSTRLETRTKRVQQLSKFLLMEAEPASALKDPAWTATQATDHDLRSDWRKSISVWGPCLCLLLSLSPTVSLSPLHSPSLSVLRLFLFLRHHLHLLLHLHLYHLHLHFSPFFHHHRHHHNHQCSLILSMIFHILRLFFTRLHCCTQFCLCRFESHHCFCLAPEIQHVLPIVDAPPCFMRLWYTLSPQCAEFFAADWPVCWSLCPDSRPSAHNELEGDGVHLLSGAAQPPVMGLITTAPVVFALQKPMVRFIAPVQTFTRLQNRPSCVDITRRSLDGSAAHT